MKPKLLLLLIGALTFAKAYADSPGIVTTKHEAHMSDRSLAYVAEAGRIPIRGMESGETRARMFYVAYRVPADRPRPLLFSWGGGPSGPALGVHMAYGPKTVTDDGLIVDNELSLLPVADLVFVDPVGTGFSRPERPGTVEEFYSTRGDARSVAEFIRTWIALHDAESSPLFLNGQSYGVWRAAIAAELLEQSGRRVSGLILTSGGMGMADEHTDRAFEIALRVPDYAASAAYHGRLPGDANTDTEDAWERARVWALDTYGPALSRVNELSAAERESIAKELARFTGYPLEKIDREMLTFTPPEYRSSFVTALGVGLDLFDMRRTNVDGGSDSRAARDRAQADYLRGSLGYRTDLAYLGLETGYTAVTEAEYVSIGRRWNYDTGDGSLPTGGGPPGKEPWIRRAIDINPDLQVFVEAAVYDSLNFCAANEDRRRRMPAELADNFELHCYFAGHGSFRDPAAYPLLITDMRAFIRRVAK